MSNTTKTNFYLIRVLGRFTKGFMTPINAHVREHGLTMKQFMVLEMLYSLGTLTMNDIIERSFSTDGNMGVVVNNLIKQGWVKKKVDKNDQRVRRISLTPNGAKVIGDYFPRHEEFINKMLEGVPERDKKTLAALLKKIGKQL